MAVMVPPEWSDKNGSAAERLVWHKLRDETPDDWFALHSVDLGTHERKPWSEVDFVLVGAGVLCLEVKGGRVTVHDGRWTTNENPLRESPFAQAGGAAAALYRDLAGRFPNVRKAVVGWGVMLPDVTFDQEGPGIVRDVLYDDRDLAARMERYVDRVLAHWRSFHGLDNVRFRPLGRSERSAIVKYLAPTFDLVPTLRVAVARAEYEFARLTAEQGRVMRGLRNKDRVLVRGGAGTGKTMLAVDEARTLEASGQRVLFCCRSPLLASHIARQIEGEVDVHAAAALMRDLIDRADAWDQVAPASEADVTDLFLPEVAAASAIELEADGRYGALILDEGQDLLTDANLEFFDTVLSGGLEGGVWRIFFDHRQNVFSTVDLSQVARLENWSVSQYDLTENCRNTPEVATLTYMLAAVEPDEVLASQGAATELRFIADRGEEPGVVASIVGAWIRRGISAGDIMVLGIEGEVPARIAAGLDAVGVRLAPCNERGEGEVGWCSIDGFKGLESQAAVVIGIADLTSRESLRRLYVGCSRPRSLLGLVLDIDLKDDFDVRAGEFGRLQAERRESGPRRRSMTRRPTRHSPYEQS
jgi:hypothetical protein